MNSKVKLMAVAIVLGMSTFIISCKKEVAGINEKDGNANLMQYNFGSMTLNSSQRAKYTFAGMTAGLLDSSVVMLYYSVDGNEWNVAGGCGPFCNYQTILYTDPAPYVEIYLKNGDGTSYSGADVTWQKSRLLIIPANKFGKKSTLPAINFNDYNEVKTYYNLKE